MRLLKYETIAWLVIGVVHDESIMGGIEYDDGGYVEKTKKEKVSNQCG